MRWVSIIFALFLKVWGCTVKVDNARLKRKAVPSSEIHLDDLNAFSAMGLTCDKP